MQGQNGFTLPSPPWLWESIPKCHAEVWLCLIMFGKWKKYVHSIQVNIKETSETCPQGRCSRPTGLCNFCPTVDSGIFHSHPDFRWIRFLGLGNWNVNVYSAFQSMQTDCIIYYLLSVATPEGSCSDITREELVVWLNKQPAVGISFLSYPAAVTTHTLQRNWMTQQGKGWMPSMLPGTEEKQLPWILFSALGAFSHLCLRGGHWT